VTHTDPNATVLDTWQQWNIDLREFGQAGVNLKDVKKMYIGVGPRFAGTLGDRTTPQAGGAGTLYFDDIRLYR